MEKKISPSVMCVDFFALGQTLCAFEECGIEYLHVDIMDGSFVPNFTLGTDFVKALKKNTKIPLDIHLMIEKPEEKLSWFEFGDGDIVSVHYESTEKLSDAINIIKGRGAKAYVAISPDTDENVLDNYLSDIDGVLVMTVRPGFAGQKMIPETLEKIARVRKKLDEKGLSRVSIEVDGNVSFENARLMNEKGADIFVAGTSSIFAKDGTIFENTEKMRKIIG